MFNSGNNLKPHTLIMKRQRGSVLIVGMILLIVMLIGAVSIMNSTVQDERMTGNARRSADAFLAAEAGMNHALSEMDQDKWYSYRCNSDGTADVYDADNDIWSDVTNPFLPESTYPPSSSYTVNYLNECTADDGFITEMRYRSVGVEAGANRIVEFSMAHGDASFPALFLNDNGNCDFDDISSTAYEVNGNGGPAVSTASAACLDEVKSEIGGYEDQFVGGAIHKNPAPDFHSAEGLENFYDQIMSGCTAATVGQCGSSNVYHYYSDEASYHHVHGFSLDDRVKANDMAKDASGNMGSLADPRIYVVDGDFESTGNIVGAGVLVVTGDAYFGGTPGWEGIIIVLGGDVTIGGGGTAPFNGTMIVSDMDYTGTTDPDDPTAPSLFKDFKEEANYLNADDLDDFKVFAGMDPRANDWINGGSGSVSWGLAGGGTSDYVYDCESVVAAYKAVLDLKGISYSDTAAHAGIFKDFVMPECSNGSKGTFGDSYITDWYEVVNN